ncbi:WD40 repeat domain-containing protein [Streptomyces sp. NBC_01506]|uniref:WD40 repeat domain-containing protein n=1 Tax=Streptomyces sp. NBC_01506 TaxID=2903887 RepID=UPI00386900B4
MSDLYGVRVLAVDPPQRRVRVRVAVIHPDVTLADDASFFLRIFSETAPDDAPLGLAVTQDQRLDEAWVDTNTRWFVESVEQLETRNYLATEETDEEEEEDEEEDEDEDEDYVSYPWESGLRFDEMSPKAAAELLRSEEARTGADYDVTVTDARWIEHLTAGDWWRTASYDTRADQLLDGEATAVPDLRNPAVVLKPFSGDNAPYQVAFSDDGRFLAVTCDHPGELVVYDTTDWRECLRARHDDYIVPWLMWVPGEPVITLRDHEEILPQLAYDAVSGAPVEAPPQSGDVASATGRYRTSYASGPAVALLSPTGDERVIPVDEAVAEDDTERVDSYEGVAFCADESKMFVALGSRVHVMDPADGRTLEVIENDGIKIRSLRVSPDGDYLAISAASPGVLEVIIRRVGDHREVTCHSIGSGWFPLQDYAMAWSPDNRWLAVKLMCVTSRHGWEAKGGEIHILPVGLPTKFAGELGETGETGEPGRPG